MIASRFNRKVSRFITKTYLSKILQQLKKEMCKWVMPIFGKHRCCFSGFQPAQQISEWTCWLLSALLYMCRLICACTTAICLMWLFWVWFFFGISKVAAIRLKRACISAECIFVCNIFEPAFQLRKKKKKSGSGSLYFAAPLQFSIRKVVVPLQCISVEVFPSIHRGTGIHCCNLLGS